MALKQYLLLMSLTKEEPEIGRHVLWAIKANIDASAEPRWVDSYGVGIFMESKLSAYQVRQLCYADSLTLDQRLLINNSLVLQVGPDFAGDRASRPVGWMNARFPKR